MAHGDITYGNLTESDIALRDHMYGHGYPFVHRGDQAYRITELVGPTHAKRWNYQAVECDPAEAEAWRQQHREDARAHAREGEWQPSATDGIVERTVRDWEEREARGEPTPRRPVDVDSSPSPMPTVPAPNLGFEPQEGWKPSYATFARANGWAGKGRIPNAIRAKYEAQHGPITTYEDRQLQRREKAAQGIRKSGIRKRSEAT